MALKNCLTGYEARQLRDALLSAFSLGELKELVRFELDEQLGNVVNTSQTNKQITLELVDWADRQNKLKKLFEGALKEVPGNPVLRQAVAEVLNVQARAEHLEALVNNNPTAFLDVEFHRDQMAAAELTVCRVENPENTPYGTGFLVGPDLVLTCRH